MFRRLNCRVSQSLWNELQLEVDRTGHSLSHIVQERLSRTYDLEHHTIFQVSTSTAVTKGLFKGCTTVADLKAHGDFGLGTFEDLDGEMILRAHAVSAGHEHHDDGHQSDKADPEHGVPPSSRTSGARVDGQRGALFGTTLDFSHGSSQCDPPVDLTNIRQGRRSRWRRRPC